MSAKKIVVIVLSSALALILGFCTFWVINNYDAIKYAMSGSALYTKADLEKAYEDGYNSAGYDVKDLNDQIKDLRNKLETKTAEYNKAKANYEEYLKKFNDLATLSEKEKAELNTTIYALNSEIAELEKDIVNLETTLETYKEFQAQLEAENTVIATFEYDGAVILLQNYEKGAKLQGVVVPEDTDEITFNGWTVNGQAVDISDYTINESTTFVADLSYHYTVRFMVDDTLYSSQTTSNGAITLPENPTKSGYTFTGWSLDGETIIDVQLSNITLSINYVAVFDCLYKYNALELIDENSPVKNSYGLWTDGENAYYSLKNEHYIFDKNNGIWIEKVWHGLSNSMMFNGEDVWTDGENIYYSGAYDGDFYSYVLNKETSTWKPIVWNSKIYGSGIWTDGENIYYSNNSRKILVLNQNTLIWEEITSSCQEYLSQVGKNIFVYDGNSYYFSGAEDVYILDKDTYTWVETSFGVFYSGAYGYWTDGENIYCSGGSRHYVLNEEKSTWDEIVWDGLSYFFGSNIWTDGENHYVVESGKTYKFVLK